MTDHNPSAPTDASDHEPQTAEQLGHDLGVRRLRLVHIRAMVHSQTTLLHESFDVEPGEADWGYCCDVACDLLNRSIGTLDPLSLELSDAGMAPVRGPMRIARAVEAIRQQLFRAHAVLQAITNLMRTHKFAENEADLGIVMQMIVENIGEQIYLLEPVNLRLPTPLPLP